MNKFTTSSKPFSKSTSTQIKGIHFLEIHNYMVFGEVQILLNFSINPFSLKAKYFNLEDTYII